MRSDTQRPAAVFAAALLAFAGGGATAATIDDRPGSPFAKIATTSSLASEGDQIRQRAYDGSPETAFRSTGAARAGDHLTLTFDAPVPVRSVAVSTGRADGTDALDAGSIEVSEDGKDFRSVATADARGVARASFPERSIRAVRLSVGRDLGHPLVVREFAIGSERVRPFRHPVEFTVVCDDAPELRGWTEETARLCEQWYDALNDALTGTDTKPPDRITLTMSKSYRGVAAASTGNSRIIGSVAWFAAHRDDQGAVIHETLHIIQRYPHYGTARAPGWLVEGIDDYIRFFFYEPGKAGPVRPGSARYDGSYRVTATFLDYLTRTYGKEIIPRIDQALRQGAYKPDLFRELTGKPVDQLNRDWRVSLGFPAELEAGPGPRAIPKEKGVPVGEIKGGDGGTSFQDEARGRLARVVVRSGEWVDSIRPVWRDETGPKEGTSHGGDGGSEELIRLEPGESLIEVSGVIRRDGDPDALIGSISFKTTKRTIGPIGGDAEGRGFRLKAPDGQEICGFRGRSGAYLNAIGIVCRPTP